MFPRQQKLLVISVQLVQRNDTLDILGIKVFYFFVKNLSRIV